VGWLVFEFCHRFVIFLGLLVDVLKIDLGAVHQTLGVGVEVGDLLGRGGDGVEMLLLHGAIEPAGSEDLDIVAVGGPAALVAAFELEHAGGDADDIAVQIDHGAAGGAVDGDGAVSKFGFPGAFAGFGVDGAFGTGAGSEEQGRGEGEEVE